MSIHLQAVCAIGVWVISVVLQGKALWIMQRCGIPLRKGTCPACLVWSFFTLLALGALLIWGSV